MNKNKQKPVKQILTGSGYFGKPVTVGPEFDDQVNDLVEQDSDTTPNLSHPQSHHTHNYSTIVKSKETHKDFHGTITEVEQVMCSRCLEIQNIKTLEN